MQFDVLDSKYNALSSLLRHRKTFYSQSGEDGFLEFVLSRLTDSDKWCVEFGAWDGKYLSNTFHLIKNKEFSSVLIELDGEKYRELCSNMAPYGAICLNKRVGFSSDICLDNILSKTPIPKNFDLLSIDVDGDDYHIWQAIVEYRPKVVIVEINAKNRPDVDSINIPGSPFRAGVSGTSIKSLTRLAESKGYSLIANIGCNAIYVSDEYYSLFYSEKVFPEDVFLYEGISVDELEWGEVNKLSLSRKVKWMIAKCLPTQWRPVAKRLKTVLKRAI